MVSVTPQDVVARFPQFAGKEQAIGLLLPEAIGQVDDRWREADRTPAVMYLVAHLLTMEEDAVLNDGMAGSTIASESFGQMSVSYASKGEASASDAQGLLRTYYGQRYAALRKANFSGPVVV